jgi:hypothetical protein
MSRFCGLRKISFESIKQDLIKTTTETQVYQRLPEYEVEDIAVKDFDYTTASGIWNMRSTTEFYKKGTWTTTAVESGSVTLDYTVNTSGTTTASYTLDFNIPVGSTITSAMLTASAAGALKDGGFLFQILKQHIDVKFNGNTLFNNQTGTTSFGTFTQVFSGNVLQYMNDYDTSADLKIIPNGAAITGNYAVRYILTLNYE